MGNNNSQEAKSQRFRASKSSERETKIKTLKLYYVQVDEIFHSGMYNISHMLCEGYQNEWVPFLGLLQDYIQVILSKRENDISDAKYSTLKGTKRKQVLPVHSGVKANWHAQIIKWAFWDDMVRGGQHG